MVIKREEVSRHYISLPRHMESIATRLYSHGNRHEDNSTLHILAPLTGDNSISIGIYDNTLGIWNKNGKEMLSARKIGTRYIAGNFRTKETRYFYRLDKAYLYLLKKAPIYGAEADKCKEARVLFLANTKLLNESALKNGVQIVEDEALVQTVLLTESKVVYFERILTNLWMPKQLNEPNRVVMKDEKYGERIELYMNSLANNLSIVIAFDYARNHYKVEKEYNIASANCKVYQTFKKALTAGCQQLLDEAGGHLSGHNNMRLLRNALFYINNKAKKEAHEYFLPMVQL